MNNLGVGLTPAHFPTSSPEDINSMFTKAKEIGDIGVMIYQWSQPDLLSAAKAMVARCKMEGLRTHVAVSPTTMNGARGTLDVPSWLRYSVGSKLSFSNLTVRNAFTDVCKSLAKLRPDYLCLATEINFLAFANINEYLQFADLVKKIIPQLRAISPNTKYTVSFQWDYFYILAKLEPNRIAEHAKLMSVFLPLDVVSLTSYPADHFVYPEDIPQDYYNKVASYLPGQAVGVSEIGWPDAGGGETAQFYFITRIPSMLSNMGFVAWSLLHDVPVLSPSLGTTGLYYASGTAKPAWQGFSSL